MTVKASLWELLDSMTERKISGWQLFAMMEARTNRATYPSTLLDYVREYCDASGASFVCVDPVRSLYEYTPGHKIAGALIDRR